MNLIVYVVIGINPFEGDCNCDVIDSVYLNEVKANTRAKEVFRGRVQRMITEDEVHPEDTEVAVKAFGGTV